MNIKNNLKNVFNKVGVLIEERKISNELVKKKIETSQTIELTNDINVIEENLIEGKWISIKNMCSYISLDQSKQICGIIPVYESVVGVVYVLQKIDNKKLFFVFTNYRIIVVDEKKYTTFNYQDNHVFEYLSRGLLTQMVNFNQIIMEFHVVQEDFNIIYGLFTNSEYRNNFIIERTKFLGGIIPIYQKLNHLNSGVSIDKDKNIVFHDKKINNYLYKYDDLLDYEILEDNTAVLGRKTRDNSRSGMKFVKKQCNRISLRITLVNNQSFELVILEPSLFVKTYDHTNEIYVKNFAFAKEIIDKLDSLNPNLNY